MQFNKENRRYLSKQLQGNISNVLKFQISDIFKAPQFHQANEDEEKNKEQILKEKQVIASQLCCQKCESLICFKNCLFCGAQATEKQIKSMNELDKRNFTWSKKISQDKSKKTTESMFLCIDLSGSMNCSYQTKYPKINKEYVIRALGQKNYTTIKGIIGQEETVKHFKGILELLSFGQSARDIAYTFKQQILMEKQFKAKSQSQSSSQQQSQEINEYITRKQIIQIGVAKYVQKIKNQRPDTLLTVIYFNNNIEFPIEDFGDRMIIPGLEDKSIEQMVSLGEFYAEKISIFPVKDVGDKLIENITKAQPNGQTALTPALAFTLGLTKKLKHDLHQIVIVTDGLSNVGFGQTEEESMLEDSKKLYKTLADDYAVKNSCVVNVIGFEDCAISYDVIDQLVSRTGGLPYSISFEEQKKEKIVTKETIQFLNLQMITGFCESTRQFCFDTKVALRCINPKIKILPSHQDKKFVMLNEKDNQISFDMGIKSKKDRFQYIFTSQDENISDEYVKFSVIIHYKRKNKRYYALREELISITNGAEEEAIKDQSATLAKEIRNKLLVHRIEQEDFNSYNLLEEKINQNAKISQNIDSQLLEKFKKKKNFIEEYDKKTDKLTKDKRTMMSRRHETYKRREPQEDEDDDDEGFL